MSEPASLREVTEHEELWVELAERCERINRAEAYDIPRRLELYNELRDRGYSLKEIAEVASTGRVETDPASPEYGQPKPLTDRAVSFTINKAKRQRAGTWNPGAKPAKKRSTRKRK